VFAQAWRFNANGTITSVFGGKCFEIKTGGGGHITTCTGSASQSWKLVGEKGTQQIKLAAGADSQCVTRGWAPKALSAAMPPATTAPAITFDIASALGWSAAHVRDLWLHKDLGSMASITVQLSGDGDSKMFKLTKVLS
jgi:hypothetical protein